MKTDQEAFVPTNSDLADMLGRTDLDFDISVCFYYLFGSKNLATSTESVPGARPSLGRAWTRGAFWPTKDQRQELVRSRDPQPRNNTLANVL